MFAYCDALIAYLCEYNRHIREMVELARVAAKLGVPARAPAIVNEWAADFITANPHQAALFAKRGWL